MPLTELRKFSSTIYQNKAAGDAAQIASASATINVYKRGATVSAGATVAGSGGTQTVSVYDIGRLAVNDAVQVGTDSTKTLTCTVITNATTITLQNNTASSIVLAQYDRLVITTSPPTLYREVTGTQSYGGTTGQTSTDSNGFVQFYTTERYIDYLVTKTGQTTALYTDEESGPTHSRRTTYNVLDFPDVATAIAAIPAGRRLYFPAGGYGGRGYAPPDANGWTISQPIEIFGDKTVNESEGFRYYNAGNIAQGASANNSNDVIFNLATGADHVWFHDLVFSNSAGTPALGTGDAIRFAGSTLIKDLALENVYIFYAGRSGLRLIGNNYVVNSLLRNVYVYGCAGDGIYMHTCPMAHLSHVNSDVNGGRGFTIQNSDNLHMASISAETNCTALSDTSLDGQIVIIGGNGGTILGGNVEDFYSGTVKNAIVLNGSCGMTVGGFQLGGTSSATSANSRGVYLYNGAKGNTILPNTATYVDKVVEIDSNAATVGNMVHPQGVQSTDSNALGRVVMPTASRNFVMATDRTEGTGQANGKGVGIVLPGLAGIGTDQVGTTALQEGLVVYDSTAHLMKFYNGSAWKTVTSS